MTDWKLLTQAAETALTLSRNELADLLRTESGGAASGELGRLISRARFEDAILSTSAGNLEFSAEPGLLEAGAAIGVWRVETLLGRGGMGEVWKAVRADGLYEQDVALKVMQPGHPSRTLRFEDERRRLARMEHPGIARIVDGGLTQDGLPWMAMEYVDGRPIDVAAAGWRTRESLRAFIDLCDAVQHAHSKLVLHRDIKPANVLVDAKGSVRLIDFGISSAVNDDDADGPLTIRSAAPEQLLGQPVSVGTDVWALGVVLHVLLTGRYPERRADASVMIDESTIRSRDLIAILYKALSPDPDSRYLSAAALGHDVSSFARNLPVDARNGGPVYRMSKVVRRYPLASMLGGTSIVALLVGLTASLQFAAQAKAGERLAEENLARSEYFFDRSEHFANAREAYANALQHLYGDGMDVERQTRVLTEIWEKAYAHRSNDPNAAAYASFALGRHFMSRNDYRTARLILEPWVEERFGPESFLPQGQILLAIVYKNSGLMDQALPLFREMEALFASGYDASSPDHVSLVTQIAEVTRSDADAARAEDVLISAIDGEHSTEVKAFFLGQLHVMRKIRRDLEGAREAILDLEQLVMASPLMAIGDRDLAQIQILNFEYYYGADPERVMQLVEALVVRSRAERGENRETGRALIIAGLVASDAGRYEEGLEKISEGIALIERFAGPASALLVNARLSAADVQTLAGDHDAAARTIDLVAAGMDADATNGWAGQRVALSRSHLAARQSGAQAARTILSQAPGGREAFESDIILQHGLKRLALLGVTFD